jgi:DNA-binding transcriptional regulator YdaS (Cro superfamily)
MAKQTPLERAIEACGSPAKLAKQLGISAQAVSQWRSVPPGRALQVANITGVPVEELLKQSESAAQ